MLLRSITILLLAVAAGLPAAAQEPSGDALAPRRIFAAEICQVDGLTPAQCDCAWQFLEGKLKPPDLRVAMLLTAANSDNSQLARRATEALAGSQLGERQRDDLQSATSALTVEAEDRCSR
jgi:hypothetical protein